ncbi:MAG: isopenicillin N synthase-like dioxygenase [Gammaproteobacteria bacterium]|jgi:isopenicillin N synthase-like dioxygenase
MSIPISRRLDFSEIPVIDLSRSASDMDSNGLVDSIRTACTNVGFFYVTGHGVDSQVLDQLIKQSRCFFNLPLGSRESIQLDQRMRGYLPLFYRSYEGESRAGTSHQEGFWIGHDRELDRQIPLQGPNQWLEELPDFKLAMDAYFIQAETLSQKLLSLFSTALALSPNYLNGFFNNPTSRLKINHYPPQVNPENVNDIGVVPHSDSGCFTILWQDKNGGLEIQNKAGDWVGAPPIEGSFVVNIGNILQYWTNGLFSSTPHRVINRNGRDRYSIPLFVNPDFETMIEPLFDSEQPDFEPFHYGKYQVDLWRNTFPIAKIP